MARLTDKTLRAELLLALEQLHDARNDGTAQASLDHANAMIAIWSLRFQLANLKLNRAADPSEEIQARHAARDASKELAEWQKRKSVAQGDLVNDLLIKDREHTEEQTALAQRAELLQ